MVSALRGEGMDRLVHVIQEQAASALEIGDEPALITAARHRSPRGYAGRTCTRSSVDLG